jgi:hypothetical protein
MGDKRMNCSKARLLIPDLLNSRMTTERKVALENHLAECDACSHWMEIWEDVRGAGLKTLTLPENLDWAPLNRSIDLAFQKHPRPGHFPKNLKAYWEYFNNCHWILPRRLFFRLAFTGSVITLLLLIGSYVSLYSTPSKPLTLQKQKTTPYPYTFTADVEDGSGRIHYHTADSQAVYIEAYKHQIRYQDQHGNVIYYMPETSCTQCHSAAHALHDTSAGVREFD